VLLLFIPRTWTKNEREGDDDDDERTDEEEKLMEFTAKREKRGGWGGSR